MSEKNTGLVAIRDGRETDAASLYEMELEIVRAGVGVVQDAADIGETVDAFATSFAEKLASYQARGCYFIAAAGDRVVGHAMLARLAPRRLRHVAQIALGVRPAFQRQGLGLALMKRVLDWAAAAEDPRIRRVELAVDAENVAARALYARHGFEVEAVRKGFIARDDGSFGDDVSMVRFFDGADAPPASE